ncbi:MAG: hypothetical protein II978_02920 [Clostridia bacterium]|nr:hypothetical protein [Clostridia bacterium]
MKDLTKGNIYKTFILFAIPLILSGLLSQAYNIIDSMIAGKFLGEHGLAATGADAVFVTFISSMFWGFGVGCSIHAAVIFGSKNYERLKSNIYSNFFIYTLSAFLIGLLAVIFKDEIFDFLNIDPSIRKDAGIYHCIIFLGQFLILLNHFFISILNAFGDTKFAFKMSLISTVLNIAGNILSVAVLKIGVAGIALSSVLAALVVDIFYIIKLKKCFRELGCDKYKIRISLDSIKSTLSYSLPTMFQQMVMYTATLIISPLVNGLGSGATAAYSIIVRIYNVNANVYQNSAKALTSYTAQSIGAKKFHLIKKGVRVGFLQGIIFLTFFLSLSLIFARTYCEAFFPKGYTGDALTYSLDFIKYFLPFIFLNMVNNLFHAFYRGIKSMNLLLLFTAIGAVSQVIASVILAKPFGMYGIYAGWVISWAVEMVLTVITYLSGTWKRSLKARLQLTDEEFNI